MTQSFMTGFPHPCIFRKLIAIKKGPWIEAPDGYLSFLMMLNLRDIQ